MKKVLSLILASLLLSASLASCSDQQENTAASPDASADSASAIEAAAEAEPEVSADDLFTVQKTDYGGATVHILTTETQKYEFDAVEYTGEGVNDAIFDRNAAVEELLGIDFDFIYKPGDWASMDVFNNLIRASIMANDGAYDVTSGMVSCIMPTAGGELFHNLYDIPGMNFDNPWWVSEMQNDLTLNGRLYGIIGDVCLSMYKGLSVVFANTTLLNDAGAENLYDVVRAGGWTLDKMISVAENYSFDGNGNGKLDADSDIAGLAIDEVPFRSLQASLDQHVIGVSEDGIPEVLPVQDAVATSVEKLTALLKNDFVPISNKVSLDMGNLFASSHASLIIAKLEMLDMFRDMENDYAILPFPRADESQSQYYTLIPTASQILFVPITVTKLEMIGQTLEALCYYSFKGVIPQYYEVSLKTKLARDKDTRETLDIIREGAVLPFEYAYSTVMEGDPWPNCLIEVCAYNDRPYASTVAANANVWKTNMMTVMERYQ